MTFVTTPYLPPIEKYIKYVKDIYSNKQLTNNGPLVNELTARLEEYLNVNNLLLTSSGTMALQVAFQIKQLRNKHALTTPFTFQATHSSLIWQNAKVKFCDIDQYNWNLDINKLEHKLRSGEQIDCVVPVHTFGNPCDVLKLEQLKAKYKFDIIYDAAHALTTRDINQESILKYGDINCFSLHATKLFHTVEGGGIICKSSEDLELAKKAINFGINGDNVSEIGINGKLSEFHAAMGLAVLDDIDFILEERNKRIALYKSLLGNQVTYQQQNEKVTTAPAYMPIVFEKTKYLIAVVNNLKTLDIFPRRYFYPCIHQTSWFQDNFNTEPFPNAENISERILCLPLHPTLDSKVIHKICEVILEELSNT